MKCILCGKEECNSYFLLQNKMCYKCAFKIKSSDKEKDEKPPKCAVCDEPISGSRRIYCSKNCSDIHKMRKMKNYWTRTIKIDTTPRNQFRF